MVLILVHTWWPHAVSADVGKAYLEVMKKYPEDRSLSKPVLTVAVKATKDGFKGLAISDIKDGKIKEAMDLDYKRMLKFGDLVKDLKYEIEIYMSGTEAMPMVGLSMPE